jgi:hypothetical protein
LQTHPPAAGKRKNFMGNSGIFLYGTLFITVAGFRNTDMIKRTVFAGIAATITSFQVILFCEYHVSIFIDVIMYAFNQ